MSVLKEINISHNAQKNKRIMDKKFSFDIRPFIIVFALIVIWIGLQIVTKGTFLSARNLSTLFVQMCTIAVIAVGMVLVIVAGHVDLSVGSVVAVCGAISAVLQTRGYGTLLGIVIPIAVGIALTSWNGFWASYQKVPAFIVTLSSMLLFRGLTLIITGGQTISSMNPEFRLIGEGYLPNILGWVIAAIALIAYLFFEVRNRKSRINKGIQVNSKPFFITKLAFITVMILVFVFVMNSYQGLPVPVIILIVTTLVIGFVSVKTRFGRRLYAIGGNQEAARFSGINVKKEGLKIFMVLGALSGLSGLLLTSRLNAATPSAGNSFEFDAISAAIIGGTSFMGGEGTVFGAIIGALIMASLNNGMSILNMPPYSQYILKGLVLLLAVWFDIKARNKGTV